MISATARWLEAWLRSTAHPAVADVLGTGLRRYDGKGARTVWGNPNARHSGAGRNPVPTPGIAPTASMVALRHRQDCFCASRRLCSNRNDALRSTYCLRGSAQPALLCSIFLAVLYRIRNAVIEIVPFADEHADDVVALIAVFLSGDD